MKLETIELTNMKKIQMMVHDERGNNIKLTPGKTVCIEGNYERYHKMMRTMHGLVVKRSSGKVALKEAGGSGNPTKRVRITNHRKIDANLDTGVNNVKIKIGPGETSEPVLVKINAIKSIAGMSVEVVAEKAEEKAEGGSDADKKAADAATKKEDADKAKVEADEAAKVADEAAKTDELAVKRKDLSLPETAEEWETHKEQMTWPDVRAISKDLGIKTRGLNKEALLDAITTALYPAE